MIFFNKPAQVSSIFADKDGTKDPIALCSLVKRLKNQWIF
jgi:hypothetical protein